MCSGSGVPAATGKIDMNEGTYFCDYMQTSGDAGSTAGEISMDEDTYGIGTEIEVAPTTSSSSRFAPPASNPR